MADSMGWTMAAAAAELAVTRGRVWQLVQEGKLATIEVHGRRYVSDFSLRQYQEYVNKRNQERRIASHAGA